jgi:hypothetical protein
MMFSKENSFCRRRSATDAVERLSKRFPTDSAVQAKGPLSPSERVGIGKRLFESLHPAEQDLILEFPVIEWDLDNEDETEHYYSDSEWDEEALCRDTAKLQVLSPIATAVRPRRLSYSQAMAMSGRECGLVRSKAFPSHLSLLDSSRKPFLHGGRVP